MNRRVDSAPEQRASSQLSLSLYAYVKAICETLLPQQQAVS